MANKGNFVVYLDQVGKEHSALVTAMNPLNEGFVTLIYIDQNAPEGDNIRKLFDVRHLSRVKEANPTLPTYHVHCWKSVGESHTALPPDHPALDNPLAPIDVDKNGNRVPIARPEYDAQVAAHRAEQAI
jgi:hypothetical protein